MSSTIFKTLITRQIDLFVGTFADDSSKLFKDENKKLIHPGEYGMYKEMCFRSLLQSVMAKNHIVSDGFIISSRDNHITKQCDVIVYDADSIPLTDGGLGKFYPVENVYAIGEVKSNLTKYEFEQALKKLAQNKMIMEDRQARNAHQEFDDLIHFDAIPTFLVCNKLMFDISKVDFEAIYDQIDRKYWHNLILSVEDGLISYQYKVEDLPPAIRDGLKAAIKEDNAAPAHQHSQFIFRKVGIYNCPVEIVAADGKDRYQHIIKFLAALKQAIDTEIRYTFDSVAYLGLGFGSD